MDSDTIGRSLLIFGLLLALIGAAVLILPRVPLIGRLPGDISIERSGISIYIPIVTSIVLSVVLTIVLNIVIRLLHK